MRLIIESVTAEAEKFRLAHNGQLMPAVDHFFGPASPLCQATRLKIVFLRQLPYFGKQRFDSDGWIRRFSLRFIAENACRPLRELVFPLLDLVGAHIKLLG